MNLSHLIPKSRYGRILQQLECLSSQDKQQQQILRIVKLLACAYRPVRVSEVEGWLVINPESDKRNGRPVIQECGPLIEILPNSIIQLVHFSAKE